jgi:hypothetical protein
MVAFKYFSGKGSGEGFFCSVDSEERPVEIGVSGGDSDSHAINNANINIDRDKKIIGYLIGNVFYTSLYRQVEKCFTIIIYLTPMVNLH